MSIFGNMFQKIGEGKKEGALICNKIDALFASVDSKLAEMDTFLDTALPNQVRISCSDLQKEITALPKTVVWLNSSLRDKRTKLNILSAQIATKVTNHNDSVAAGLVEKARRIIGNVEGRRLDEQQMRCIVKPAASHLVIAGAGTGKTTTIVGKVKYLLKSGQCNENEILVLSYTNASASEMRNRINSETGRIIEASTFHKLGLNIICDVELFTPKITKIQLQAFAKAKLNEYMKDPQYLGFINQFFLYNHKYAKSEFDFQNKKEYEEYLRMNPPVTLKGERVKSYGEMYIANYLYSNGIEYRYESEYEKDTRLKEYFQYYPDFFLPKHRVYIEYYGINEKGEVPSYFSAREGKTPSEEYREGMEWKRKLHEENKTVLVEQYAYECSKGTLLSSLEKNLKKAGVVGEHPLSAEELWNKVSKNNSANILTGLAELIETIISLLKSNECDSNRLRQISFGLGRRNTPIVDITVPIFKAYDDALKRNDEIDFNDMIIKATKMVRSGQYVNPYKYVIVDEYQDISRSRYNLLKALRESSYYKLFCVGDDWQSIYRFTGSDLDYILNFSKYWGPTEYSKIETTYRFTDSLIDISGRFVMKNPSQIKKSISGVRSKFGFAMGEIKGYKEEWAIKFMIDRLRELPPNSSVFFIGRYTHDSKLLSNCRELECRYDQSTQLANVVLPDRRDLKMQFLTAHKSKGLQADYVFIVNNKNYGMGFPSKIQDDPIVDSLLEGKESYPFAEERRLFYVALTRAKIKSFLVVVDKNESAFATEMEQEYADELKKELYTCPLCGGKLKKMTGPQGEFFGCTNYQYNGCKFVRKVGRRK